MSHEIGNVAGAPWWVTFFNPVARRVLATGVPLGYNGLLTIRGRKSGLPRTTPLAIIEVGGRRWVWAPWGEVQWVRNLRAFRPRDHRRGRPERRSKRDRAGPGTASWLLSRHPRSSRARHTARCLVHSHRRWCRSRPSGGSGRGPTCLRTPPNWMTTAAEARDRASPAEPLWNSS